MMGEIKNCFDANGISIDDDMKHAADLAVDCALNYVLSYVNSMSEELSLEGLHSETMAAGLLRNKLKGLLGES
jgi:hypothetical protein